MADTSLQDRLREHAAAFDGLLSLIPAKMYYGEDTSDQWKKKKQTKDQAKAAKRGKLDPDSELHRNAKEVLEERARNKRKLQELDQENDSAEDDEDGTDESIIGVEKEKPGEGLKKRPVEEEPTAKKPKLAEDVTTTETTPATPKIALTEKQKAKEEKKAAKKLQKEETKKAKGKKAGKDTIEVEETGDSDAKQTAIKPSTEVDVDEDAELAEIDVSGLVPEADESESADSSPKSPVFDSQPSTKNDSVEPASSTTTSVSSVAPPSETPRKIRVPADTTALRARLAAKLEALRAARKVVDDANGTPIRTRQDLLESRREKEAQRKARKREARKLAKEAEDQKREEILASARNSPASILSPVIHNDHDDRNANHFAFGRLAFADGVQMSQDLSYEKSTDKKKGPMDPKSALAKFESQKKRLAALDEDKRKEVLEKETWLAARRRVEGEKVHDDESLLKKAVKRKEKAKKKSEKEWSERKKGVEDAIKGRQHKREENLRKRREEKGSKKGKKGKGVAIKKKNRPGFEGGFGGGGGSKKK